MIRRARFFHLIKRMLLSGAGRKDQPLSCVRLEMHMTEPAACKPAKAVSVPDPPPFGLRRFVGIGPCVHRHTRTERIDTMLRQPRKLKLSLIDHVEIYPVRDITWSRPLGAWPNLYPEDHEPVFEPCEPSEAHFWSAFAHLRTGGLDDLMDFETEDDAEVFAQRFRAMIARNGAV